MDDSYIIAIDFGTAYSGYAYSLTRRQADIDPYLKVWGQDFAQRTPKAPTCILFNEQGEFLKFGYEAQMTYCKMRGEEAKGKFFFECFKMSLYGKKLCSDVTIEAANGKSMKALKVFTEALRYLKDDALETIAENTSGRKFIASDFTWVLTVPAIWDPSAKQFMRDAATQAGIVTTGREDRLVIALEPEAASVWCKKLPADGFIAETRGEEVLDKTPGLRYILVDCGGGTIDITVHEVLDGEAVKELHKASGNDMGGQTVDRKFKEFLKEVFCDGVWDEYEKRFPGELQEMMYHFTVLKRNNSDVEISCPFNLGVIAGKKKEIEKFFEPVLGATWNEGSIKISKEKLRSFYENSLRGITNNLQEILKKGFNIQYILLVGGFAESQILRQHVRNKFGGQCKVLCPSRPQEAIVKGAVMFGRNPAVVASRKSAFTYGFDITQSFDESKHKAEKKIVTDGRELCDDIFSKLVEVNEDVEWDETREHTLYPTKASQTKMSFKFYRTERENPMYVDEWGLEEVGSCVVPMPITTRGRQRQVKLKIRFGFTEMKATATDLDSGSTDSIRIDFMTKS